MASVKVQRTINNLIFGVASKFILMAAAIVVPKLFIENFGSDVNGLISSIAQIFVYIGLLEAGVGIASMQALYKPITDDNKEQINSVMAATHYYYKRTGIYYLIAVVTLAMIYPLIVSVAMPYWKVASLILLMGMSGVINFTFQGKYFVLLTAEGKSYVNTYITTAITLVSTAVKIALLVFGFDVIIVQTAYLIISLFQMCYYWYYIHKHYGWLDLKSTPDFKSISQKNSVMVHQISSLVFNNTDILILTFFCNLKVVSVYVIYNMIFTSVETFGSIINGSFTAALAQTYHTSKDKYIKYYDLYENFYVALIFGLMTVTYMLIRPFIHLYTINVTDISYADYWLPILFVIVKLLSSIRMPALNAINVAGHFSKTQNRSIAESAINLIVTIVAVQFLGIYGVLIGTIVALLYRSVDMVVYANVRIMDRGFMVSLKRWVVNTIIMISLILVWQNLNYNLDSYLDIFVSGFILTSLVIPIFFVIICLVDQECGKTAYHYIQRLVKKQRVA